MSYIYYIHIIYILLHIYIYIYIYYIYIYIKYGSKLRSVVGILQNFQSVRLYQSSYNSNGCPLFLQ